MLLLRCFFRPSLLLRSFCSVRIFPRYTCCLTLPILCKWQRPAASAFRSFTRLCTYFVVWYVICWISDSHYIEQIATFYDGGAYFGHLLCHPPIIIDHLINRSCSCSFLLYKPFPVQQPSSIRPRPPCLPIQSALAGDIGTKYVSYQPCFALLRHVSYYSLYVPSSIFSFISISKLRSIIFL